MLSCTKLYYTVPCDGKTPQFLRSGYDVFLRILSLLFFFDPKCLFSPQIMKTAQSSHLRQASLITGSVPCVSSMEMRTLT